MLQACLPESGIPLGDEEGAMSEQACLRVQKQS